jgi:primosomal protein N' (replication factor Y)
MTARGEDTGPTLPVARVVVDTPLAHLDRPFEYAVPAELDDTALPGVRVRVRFAGKTLDGFVLERTAEAEHRGRLAALQKVVSPEPVLAPELARLCREVADHYAGSMADVLRLAVPPRHATAERTVPPAADPGEEPAGEAVDEPLDDSAWLPYPAGPAFLRRLADGEGPAAAWLALPDAGSDDGWPLALAQAVAATRRSGRGAVVVLPDHRDVDRLGEALDRVLGPGSYVRLTADQGPQRRYADWLRVLRGHVHVAIGSRSAAFAPVRRPGLLAWWDDGDDLHQEPRSPYPHVREVLRRRAAATGAGLLVGGYTRTPQVQDWLARDRLREVVAAPATVRERAPRVLVAGEGTTERSDPAAAVARIPTLAWRTVRDGLARGPVLVQVPRRGYLVGLSCQECRTPVRCPACGGPLRVPAPGARPVCAWCGETDDGRPCRSCGATVRRSTVVGERRTAEELGRAFQGVPVRTSRAGHLLDRVAAEPAVVVATPGAEPVAEGGYAATLLLDGWALLDRAGLDTGVETVRRWAAAAALTRPAPEGGTVVLVGVPPHGHLRPVEALVRWAPAWYAAGELSERVELRLPPAFRTARLSGPPEAVEESLAELDTPPGVTVLGPMPAGVGGAPAEEVQVLLRAEDDTATALVTALQALRAARSARKAEGALRVQLDPPDLGV